MDRHGLYIKCGLTNVKDNASAVIKSATKKSNYQMKYLKK